MRIWMTVALTWLIFAGGAAAEAPLKVERAHREVVLTGYTRGKTHVEMASEVSGKVLSVNYDVGSVVGDGPFVVIDPTFIDFDIRTTRHEISKLEVALERSRSRIAFLKKEFERIDTLYRGSSASAQRRDQIAQDLDQAFFDERSLDVELSAAQTRLAEIRERRNRYQVFAPKGWIVTARRVDAGEIVTASSPLATVADYGNLVVPLAVAAPELAALRRLPDVFDARLDDIPARATLNWVNPDFNETTRKLSIEIGIRAFNGKHRGGLVFTLPLRVRDKGLQVPKSAILNRYENPRVRIQETGREVRVLILGESNSHVRIAESPLLPPGTELSAVEQ